MFYQFYRHLADKDKPQAKDEVESEKIQRQMAEFLQDVYPGIKQMPNKLINLMSSPEPEVALSTAAILNPEEDCNDDQSQQGSRKKRSGSKAKY